MGNTIVTLSIFREKYFFVYEAKTIYFVQRMLSWCLKVNMVCAIWLSMSYKSSWGVDGSSCLVVTLRHCYACKLGNGEWDGNKLIRSSLNLYRVLTVDFFEIQLQFMKLKFDWFELNTGIVRLILSLKFGDRKEIYYILACQLRLVCMWWIWERFTTRSSERLWLNTSFEEAGSLTVNSQGEMRKVEENLIL